MCCCQVAIQLSISRLLQVRGDCHRQEHQSGIRSSTAASRQTVEDGSYLQTSRIAPGLTPNNDIVTAYKELKKHMTKAQGNKIAEHVTSGPPKSYLRPTIAIQQHSNNRMNKELLRYSLQQRKLRSFCSPVNLILVS